MFTCIIILYIHNINMTTLDSTFNDIKNQLNKDFSNSNFKDKENSNLLRMNTLNDSYRKRYIEYIKIILVIVIGLVCIWLCRILDTMDIIPSSIINLVMIVVVSLTIIVIYILYQKIQVHNLIVFDQINYHDPYLQKVSTNTGISTTTPTPTSTPESSGETCKQPIIVNNPYNSFISSLPSFPTITD